MINLPRSFTVCIDWHAWQFSLEECRQQLSAQGDSIARALVDEGELVKGRNYKALSGLKFILIKAEDGGISPQDEDLSYELVDFQIVACSYFLLYGEFRLVKRQGRLQKATESNAAPKLVFRQDPPHLVIWTLTGRCHLTCPHCYYFGDDIEHYEDLCLSDARSILDQIADCNISTVSFSGGEPLLHPHIWELVAHAKSNGTRTILDTSGLLFEDDQCRRGKQNGIDSIIVSFDGNAEDHDSSRGGGSFDKTIAAIKRASAAGIFTAVNIVLTTKNARSAEEALVKAIEAGADLVKLENALPAGRARSNKALLVPNYAELKQLAAELDALRLKYRDSVLVVLPIAVQAILREVSFYCSSGQGVLSISNDGFLSPCPSLTHLYREDDSTNLMKTPLRRVVKKVDFRKSTALSTACRSCSHGRICLSGCLTRSINLFNNPLARDPICIEYEKDSLRKT